MCPHHKDFPHILPTQEIKAKDLDSVNFLQYYYTHESVLQHIGINISHIFVERLTKYNKIMMLKCINLIQYNNDDNNNS